MHTCRALSAPVTVATLNYDPTCTPPEDTASQQHAAAPAVDPLQSASSSNGTTVLQPNAKGCCDAVVVWVEYDLGQEPCDGQASTALQSDCAIRDGEAHQGGFWREQAMFRDAAAAAAVQSSSNTLACITSFNNACDEASNCVTVAHKDEWDCTGWFTGGAKQLVRFLHTPVDVSPTDSDDGGPSSKVSVCVTLDVEGGTGHIDVEALPPQL